MDDLTKSARIERMVIKPGLRAKVDAKCYDPYAKGTWRKQVEECTCYTCPMYTVRTKSTSTQK